MKLSDIKTNPDNPRVIKDEAFNKLVQSIRDFPKMMALRPMVVDDNLTVLGGNMRLRALRHLGYKDIPDEWVKRASDLTEEEQKQFIIKDNVSVGDWDWDTLANEWDVQDLKDWGLEMPADWGVERVEAKEDDYEIPDEIQTDIQPGDLLQIGNHRLLCGDATKPEDYKRLFGEEKIQLVVTDPPYNVAIQGGNHGDPGRTNGLKIKNDSMSNDEFYEFLLQFFKSVTEYTKPGGGVYIFHADSEGLNFRRAFNESGLMLKQCLIWVKNTLVMGRQDYQWRHEPILYGWKPGAAHYFTKDRTHDTVLEFDRPRRSTEHPTMKPVELLSFLITNSSKPGWLVGDPFAGSGSTMVAAHQLNRKCYGMELDCKYAEVIVRRMIKLDNTLTIKRNGIDETQKWLDKTAK